MKKIALFSFLFITLDLFSKYLISNYLEKNLIILGDFFKLSYAENYGIAFSIQIPFYLIFLLNLLILILFSFFIIKEINTTKLLSQIFCSLILGGGIGNLIDRGINGFVIDFISIFSYPTFNLADIFITIGVFSFVLFYGKIFRTKKTNK